MSGVAFEKAGGGNGNHLFKTGNTRLESDTDRAGTSERAAADGDSTLVGSGDTEPERIVDPLAADADGLDDVPQGFQSAVRQDGNLITSRKPDDIPAFNRTLIAQLSKRKAA
ncbi:putative intracellular protease/amidase [Paraburkholderia sp. GAS448]